MNDFLLTTRPGQARFYELGRQFVYSRTAPIPLRNTRHVAVFLNGALFNLRHLRSELNDDDFSPEEVVAALYLNNRGFSSVIGHFSAVIVDLRRRVLTGITDRECVGELYYHTGQSDHITIAPRFIRLLPYSQRDLDEYALACFFCLGDTERQDTLVKDIKRIAQFYTLHFDNHVTIKSDYLSKLSEIRVHPPPALKDVLDHLELLLRNTITGLVANYGLLCNTLSGGVDSSYLQTLLLEQGHADSFSIAFEDSGRDNLYAADVARYLHTNHEAIHFHAKEFLPQIEHGIKVTGKPHMYQGEAMFLKLYNHIANRVPNTIVISGQTADGALDAAPPRPIQVALRHEWLPGQLLDPLLTKISPEWRGLAAELRHERISSSTIRRIERRTDLCQRVARYLGGSYDVYAHIANLANGFAERKEDKLARAHLYSGEMRRIPNMLHMLGHSVGLRVAFPFLNPAFLEYTLTLPAALKHKKYLGKKLAERHVSRAYVYRPKIGKDIPYGKLFREEERWVELLKLIKQSNYYGFDVDAMMANQEYLLLLRLINFHIWRSSILNSA